MKKFRSFLIALALVVSITLPGVLFSQQIFEYTKILRAPTGSATTPAYSFGIDTNTGIYSAGADSLGVSIGGTARETKSTTSNTTTLLQLGPAGAVGGPAYSFSGDPDSGFYQTGTANTVAIGTNGGAKITVGPTETTLHSVSGDGTGKVICIKSDGTLGTCGDTPTGGSCTCA